MITPGAPLPRSERLTFRWWSEDDRSLAQDLWGDPQVTRHIDARGQLDAAQIEDRLQQELRCAVEHGVQYWPIFWAASGEHVGCAGLRPRAEEAGVYELGFHLRSAWWGRGLASEAARAVIANAFEHRGARALFAGHSPHNTASARVLARLGFVHTHDEHYPPTGAMHPRTASSDSTRGMLDESAASADGSEQTLPINPFSLYLLRCRVARPREGATQSRIPIRPRHR